MECEKIFPTIYVSIWRIYKPHCTLWLLVFYTPQLSVFFTKNQQALSDGVRSCPLFLDLIKTLWKTSHGVRSSFRGLLKKSIKTSECACASLRKQTGRIGNPCARPSLLRIPKASMNQSMRELLLPQTFSETWDVCASPLVLQHMKDPEMTRRLRDGQCLARGWCIKASSSLALPVFFIPHTSGAF